MALITIDEYREKYFGKQSQPSRYCVRNWIRNGELPAQKRGRQYFIDTELLQKRQTGNRLADKILNQGVRK